MFVLTPVLLKFMLQKKYPFSLTWNWTQSLNQEIKMIKFKKISNKGAIYRSKIHFTDFNFAL